MNSSPRTFLLSSQPFRSDLVVAFRALLRALGGFLRRLVAGGCLRDHVDDDEVRQRAGRGVAELSVVAGRAQFLHRVAIRQVLWIDGPDGILRVRGKRMGDVADARL